MLRAAPPFKRGGPARTVHLNKIPGIHPGEETYMGRGILLWMLGVPIPIILLLALCSHH